MKNNQESVRTPQELYAEMQALVAEAQTLMGDSISEHTTDAVGSLRQRFAAAQASFSEAYAGAREKVCAGAKYTDQTIRANPYQALAIAAGVGLLLGVLVGRRSK